MDASNHRVPNRPRVLELQGFRVAYRHRVVLSGVDLEVLGDVPQVLVGPVAAGKSTLLRTLGGLNFHNEAIVGGQARLLGRPLSQENHVALVGQQASAWIGSVADGLIGAASIHSYGSTAEPGIPRKARLECAVAMLERLDLHRIKGLLERPMLELSMLDARLAMLVRFAAEFPAMLALDEPTVGMNDGDLREYCAILRKVAEAMPTLSRHTQSACCQRDWRKCRSTCRRKDRRISADCRLL
jgi:ABC-type molybdenum transport system ATPase subunit/photorepair protein PhrA